MKYTRGPVVAGSFYEATEARLKNQIEKCFLHKIGPGKIPEFKEKSERKILGLVSPHAGYIYSGAVASWGFYNLAKEKTPKVVIILGPNHRGIGERISVYPEGFWQTPLGKISINKEIIEELTKNKIIKKDTLAHQFEHSLEVQVPFLQYIYGDNFTLVPICMLDQTLTTSQNVGEILAKVLKDEDFLIIASTDFTHYESQKEAERKDKKVIENIIKLDEEKIFSTVQELDVSMCGYGPVIALVVSLKLLGIKEVNLLKYATSGDITQSYDEVVAYASIEMER